MAEASLKFFSLFILSAVLSVSAFADVSDSQKDATSISLEQVKINLPYLMASEASEEEDDDKEDEEKEEDKDKDEEQKDSKEDSDEATVSQDKNQSKAKAQASATPSEAQETLREASLQTKRAAQETKSKSDSNLKSDSKNAESNKEPKKSAAEREAQQALSAASQYVSSLPARTESAGTTVASKSSDKTMPSRSTTTAKTKNTSKKPTVSSGDSAPAKTAAKKTKSDVQSSSSETSSVSHRTKTPKASSDARPVVIVPVQNFKGAESTPHNPVRQSFTPHSVGDVNRSYHLSTTTVNYDRGKASRSTSIVEVAGDEEKTAKEDEPLHLRHADEWVKRCDGAANWFECLQQIHGHRVKPEGKKERALSDSGVGVDDGETNESKTKVQQEWPSFVPSHAPTAPKDFKIPETPQDYILPSDKQLARIADERFKAGHSSSTSEEVLIAKRALEEILKESKQKEEEKEPSSEISASDEDIVTWAQAGALSYHLPVVGGLAGPLVSAGAALSIKEKTDRSKEADSSRDIDSNQTSDQGFSLASIKDGVMNVLNPDQTLELHDGDPMPQKEISKNSDTQNNESRLATKGEIDQGAEALATFSSWSDDKRNVVCYDLQQCVLNFNERSMAAATDTDENSLLAMSFDKEAGADREFNAEFDATGARTPQPETVPGSTPPTKRTVKSLRE